MKLGINLYLVMSFFSLNCLALEMKIVPYKSKDKNFEGVFIKALPSASQKISAKPLILMIHNWMGITEETKTQGKRFAELGYNVFLADIYGKDQRPKDVKEAGALAGMYKKDRKLFRENIKQALQTAKKLDGIQELQTAVVGYCFGGTGAIEIARSGEPLKGIISFHGGLDSLNPLEAKQIKAPILVLHGEDDPFVPMTDVIAFEKELKDAKVSYSLIKYPKAVHSFTEKAAGNDNSKGAAYNEYADKKSFEEAKKFLAQIFKS